MAEDKLGTLEYDMLINEEKLTKQLQDIDKLLKVQDDKWKEALSNLGSGSVGTIDTSKLITANKAVVTSTTQITTSIKQLEDELTRNEKKYKSLSAAKREDSEQGRALLATINQQKDQLKEFNKTLDQTTTKRRTDAAEAKKIAAEQKSAKVSLEGQRSRAFVAEQLAEEKKLTEEIKKQEGAKASLDAQRSRALIAIDKENRAAKELLKTKRLAAEKQLSIAEALPKNSVERIKEYIKYLQILRSQSTNKIVTQDLTEDIAIEKKKRDQLISTLKKEKAQRTANLQQEKLQERINAQQVGSIGRLRAEYALYVFQLNQVGKTIPYSTAKIRQLTAAMAANKRQIQALQPTLNMWGKLASAIKTYATAYLSVQAVIGLGRSIFTQTKELDQLNFSMQTIIKSSKELAETQKFLSDIAINYGGDLLTLSERYIKFRAAAVQSNVSAGETQKIFDSVSKAAGTLGLKTHELSGVYLALEQMLSKGKVTTEELRRQLGERLPGAFGIMATALGVTIPQLDKMLKKGEVLSTEALPKFAAALESAYGIESLKKIDTLAAAQGRMSTQFTELIRGIGASDTFKSAINGIAAFMKIIRDNLGTIKFLAKAFLTVITAMVTYRIVTALSIPIQKALLATFGFQTKALARLTFAQLRLIAAQRAATVGTTAWTRAWKALTAAFVSNPLTAILTAITLIGTALYLFINRTKDASEETIAFAEQIIKAKKNIDNLFESMGESTEESNRFKNSIAKINFQLAKYNLELITSKSTVEELTQAHKELNSAIVEGMFAKERASRIDTAEGEYAKAQAGVIKSLIDKEIFSPDIQEDAFSYMLDLAEDSSLKLEDRISKIKQEFGDTIGKGWFDEVVKLSQAADEFKATMDDINRTLPEIINPDVLDISGLKDQLKTAKEEFEKVVAIGAENVEGLVFFDKEKGIEDYKDYLNGLLKEYEQKIPLFESFKEFSQAPDIEKLSLDEQEARYSKYSKNIIANNKARFKATEQILLELSELEEKATKAKSTGKDPRLVSLEAQLALLEKMKQAYDKLAKVVSPEEAAAGVLDEFGARMDDLDFQITPDLNTENFNAVMEQIANVIERFDKKLAQTIRNKIAGVATDQTITDVKKVFAVINAEIAKFKEADTLRQSIFDITGDAELSIKLTTDKNEVEDIVSYMKGKVEEMGREGGFDKTFDELADGIEDLTPILQKEILGVQKYVADKSKNILLDSLKFMYEGLAEGTDIQFDFSNVIVELNKSLEGIKQGAQDALESGVFDDEEIAKRAKAWTDATNEVASNAVEKLGANYIKDNLPEQLANDFAHLADASSESIRSIVAEIDKMQNNLRSRESIESFFNSAGLDLIEFSPIIDSFSNTDNIDEFLEKINELKAEIATLDKDGENFSVGDTFVNKEDLAKLELTVELIEKLLAALAGGKKEAGNKDLENLAKHARELGSELNNLIDTIDALADSFGVGFSESGKAALEGIKTTASGITTIISATARLAKEGISSLEKASVILLIASQVLKIIQGINDVATAGKEAELAKPWEEFEKWVTLSNRALERYIKLRDDAIGAAKYTSQDDLLAGLEESKKRTEEELSLLSFTVDIDATGWFGGAVRNVRPKVKELEKLLQGELDRVSSELELGLFGWEKVKETYSFDINQLLFDENSEFTIEKINKLIDEGLITDQKVLDAVAYYETIIDDLAQAEEYKRELLTATMASDIASSISDGFKNGLQSAADFAQTFEDYVRGAIENGLEILSEPAFTQWYADLAEAMDSEGLDKDEVSYLKKEWERIVEIQRQRREETYALTGLSPYPEADVQGGISKAIQGVTEDTARRLEGLINSIRETSVASMGNTDAIVRSNELIQAYSGQSLAKLTNIDTNIAAQLALFNGIMTSASGVGGQGLKVYVQ